MNLRLDFNTQLNLYNFSNYFCAVQLFLRIFEKSLNLSLCKKDNSSKNNYFLSKLLAQKHEVRYIKNFKGWLNGSSGKGTCLASVRP
jgi:hypothetical protein